MSQDAKDSNTGAVSSESASRNVSCEKRIELGKKIEKIREFLLQRASEDKNAKNLLDFIADLRKELQAKKYGLVFEEHREKIDDYLENNIPVLTENKELFINGGGELNFLIEGDNLASLQLLERTHKGRIDMIYIDPPYNTGSKDFRYGDHFVDSVDTFRHSKWLSFMSNRLRIAKELLSERGVIFISIDDNEQAPLKLLCDEIFGERSFIATIHCQMSTTQGMKVKAAQEGNIVKNAEYVLCYTRDGHNDIASEQLLYDLRPEYDDHYNLFIKDDGTTVNLSAVYDYGFPKDCSNKKPMKLKVAFDKSEDFANFVRSHINEIVRLHDVTGVDAILGLREGHWKAIERNGKPYLLTLNSTGKPQQLLRLKDSWGETDGYYGEEGLRKIRGDWWEGFYVDMGNVSKEGGVPFKNGKKPIRLILQLAKMCTKKGSTILDFFAGSGTTGHAVMQLNKEDGGERRFILCTNNENNICREVTHKRIENAIKLEGHKASLKYFRVDFVPMSEKVYQEYADELLTHIRELVELENAINFTGNAKIAIILTEEELDAFTGSLGEGTECEVIYLGHNILVSAKQQRLFAKRGIKINKIPDYYFKELSIL